MHKLSLLCLIAFALLLGLLGGCATPPPPDVGAVVLAPQVQLPPPPVIVQRTMPRPVGFFQNVLADYFERLPPTPTR